MLIGKIARSSSHVDYVCQVYQFGEVATAPQPTDHAFGTFVRVAAGPGQAIAGLIYDTILTNPDFGALGPRLSPAPDLAIFSPDYLSEKITLAGILAVGTLGPGEAIYQGVPAVTAQIDALVERMGDDEVLAFHADGAGGLRLGYAPLLVAHGSPLAAHLLLKTIEYLEGLCPAAGPRLRVIRDSVAWRAVVEPLG